MIVYVNKYIYTLMSNRALKCYYFGPPGLRVIKQILEN